MPVRFFELSGASLLYNIWQPVWKLNRSPDPPVRVQGLQATRGSGRDVPRKRHSR